MSACSNGFPHCPRCDACVGEIDQEVTVIVCSCDQFVYLPGLDGWYVSWSYISTESDKLAKANPELMHQVIAAKKAIDN